MHDDSIDEYMILHGSAKSAATMTSETANLRATPSSCLGHRSFHQTGTDLEMTEASLSLIDTQEIWQS